MKKQYIKFLSKVGLLALPVLCLLLLYVYLDPFKVIYKYDSYYRSGYPAYIGLDRDYVSTQTFINNSPKYNYNAFIFGNSRSRFYQVNTWKKYIHTDSCFHFDASGESLLGIARKFNFLNNRHFHIAHALITLDYSTLDLLPERTGNLFLSHPALSNQNWFSFELEFFKTFLSRNFFVAYMDFNFTHQVKDYMKANHLLSDVPLTYIITYNEIEYKSYDELINSDPARYYDKKRMQSFYTRDTIQKYSPEIISEEQYKLLTGIVSILKSNKTDYKVVIHPLYDQLKLSNEDMQILYQLFGKENVYDFSGINSITNDYHNYYEESHYRPPVSTYIMGEIYGNK